MVGAAKEIVMFTSGSQKVFTKSQKYTHPIPSYLEWTLTNRKLKWIPLMRMDLTIVQVRSQI
jgi:hypothetical protein